MDQKELLKQQLAAIRAEKSKHPKPHPRLIFLERALQKRLDEYR